MPLSFHNVKNNAETLLASALLAGATTMQVAEGAASFPAAPFWVTCLDFADGVFIPTEIVEVTAKSGNTWTISRGCDGTTDSAHAMGTGIRLLVVADIVRELQDAERQTRELAETKISEEEKGVPGGVPTLDEEGLVPLEQLPPMPEPHPAVSAGDGISVDEDQVVSNTDKGSDARAAHEIAFAHDEIAGNTASRHDHTNKAELDKIVTAVLSVAGKTGIITLSKSDVGLSNVINALQVLASEKGAAGGVVPLGPDGKIATEYLNPVAITNVYPVASEVEHLALEAQSGDVAVRSDQGKSYIHNGGDSGTMADWTWLASPTDLVLSVNGKIGTVVLAKADVGLHNVDNLQQLPMSYLDTDGALTDNSDAKVPSQQAVKEYADTKAASNHNHNLADLTEKSYNSLTDKPEIPTIPSAFPKYLLPADYTDSPNNANWAVNALAPIEADEDNVALKVAAYVHTSETGRGLDCIVPSGATNIIIAVKGRAKTAPATAKQVVLKVYSRGIPDNAAVEAWSAGYTLTAIDIPANEYYQYDSQTIALATLGLTAGRRYQLELTRTPAAEADTLDATWYMDSLEVSFS